MQLEPEHAEILERIRGAAGHRAVMEPQPDRGPHGPPGLAVLILTAARLPIRIHYEDHLSGNAITFLDVAPRALAAVKLANLPPPCSLSGLRDLLDAIDQETGFCTAGHPHRHSLLRCPVPGCADGPVGVSADDMHVTIDDEPIDVGAVHVANWRSRFDRKKERGAWLWKRGHRIQVPLR